MKANLDKYLPTTQTLHAQNACYCNHRVSIISQKKKATTRATNKTNISRVYDDKKRKKKLVYDAQSRKGIPIVPNLTNHCLKC